MTLDHILKWAINPALALLPPGMDTPAARVMLLAIGLQESRFEHRRQIRGPARGFWQFEKGTRVSRGGCWGVYLHAASKGCLAALCRARSVACNPDAIYASIEYDDTLAAGVARLLLWTDPKALPPVGDAEAAWSLYLRTWRPGKPHLHTWGGLYAQALTEMEGGVSAWIERVKGGLFLAGLALAALVGIFYRGRATGRQVERQEQVERRNEQAAKARKEVHDVQMAVARKDDDAVAAGLKSRWVRGSGGKGGR